MGLCDEKRLGLDPFENKAKFEKLPYNS